MSGRFRYDPVSSVAVPWTRTGRRRLYNFCKGTNASRRSYRLSAVSNDAFITLDRTPKTARQIKGLPLTITMIRHDRRSLVARR